MGHLVPDALRDSARRLFWAAPGGQVPADDVAGAAVILAEGDRREWAQIGVRALAARPDE